MKIVIFNTPSQGDVVAMMSDTCIVRHAKAANFLVLHTNEEIAIYGKDNTYFYEALKDIGQAVLAAYGIGFKEPQVVQTTTLETSPDASVN